MKERLDIKITHETESKSPYGLTEREKHQRKIVNLRPETLDSVCQWIDAQIADPAMANELKEMAGRYPHAALGQFKKNFKSLYEKIIMAKRKQAHSTNINQEPPNVAESCKIQGSPPEGQDNWRATELPARRGGISGSLAGRIEELMEGDQQAGDSEPDAL
jgi:hypothetical protein